MSTTYANEDVLTLVTFRDETSDIGKEDLSYEFTVWIDFKPDFGSTDSKNIYLWEIWDDDDVTNDGYKSAIKLKQEQDNSISMVFRLNNEDIL